MGLVFELKEFSGPLELLLHLIGNARIDIKDIFVSQVTQQYIDIVSFQEQVDMEEASGFVQMAATLLLIKSRSILPPVPGDFNEGEGNPEEDLIRQLEEYARFQQLASQMQEFEKAAMQFFSKLPEEVVLPPPVIELDGLTLEGLLAAYANLLSRTRGKEEEAPALPGVIRLDQHSVARSMGEIMKRTRRGSASFFSLLSPAPSRNEVVTLFLALLELLKQGRIRASQEQAGGEILLSRNSREGRAHGE